MTVERTETSSNFAQELYSSMATCGLKASVACVPPSPHAEQVQKYAHELTKEITDMGAMVLNLGKRVVPGILGAAAAAAAGISPDTAAILAATGVAAGTMSAIGPAPTHNAKAAKDTANVLG